RLECHVLLLGATMPPRVSSLIAEECPTLTLRIADLPFSHVRPLLEPPAVWRLDVDVFIAAGATVDILLVRIAPDFKQIRLGGRALRRRCDHEVHDRVT